MSRFIDINNPNSLLSGRVYLWKKYFNAIFSSFFGLLFGYGLYGKLLDDAAAHNTFLEIIYKFGIVGFIVNIIYYYFCVSQIPKTKKYYLKDWAVSMIFFAPLFNLSAYTFYSLWTCLFIIVIFIRDGVAENETINNSSNI